MSRKKKLLINLCVSLCYQILSIVSGFILPKAILTAFGSSVYGLVNSISQFLGFISLLECGISSVVSANLYSPLANNDTNTISKVFKSSEKFFRTIAYIFVAYVVILAFVYPHIVDSYFNYPYTATLILILSISAIAEYYVGISYKIVLNADQHSYISVTLQIVTLVISTIVSVVLIKMGASIHWVKLTAAMCYVIQPICMKLYVDRHYHINHNIVFTGEPIKQKWNGFAQHIAYIISTRTDIIVLTLFSTLENVAVYGVYNLVLSGIANLIDSISLGFTSLIGNLLANEEKEKLDQFFDCYEWVSHTIITWFYGLTVILIVEFVRVYTKGINDANYIVPLFAFLITIANAARQVRTPYNTVVNAAGHYKQTQVSAIIEAVLNVGLSILLVFEFGLIGVAIGTLVSMMYRTCYLAWYLSKNILYRHIFNYFKHIIVDILVIALLVVISKFFSVQATSYIEWFVIAVKSGCLSLAVIFVVNIVFYKEVSTRTIKWLFGRKRLQ